MRSIALALSTLFMSTVSIAETPPLEAFGALPQVSDATISPDGSNVAMIVNLDSGTRLAVMEVGVGFSLQMGVNEIKARSVDFYDNDYATLTASETTRTFGFRGEYEYSGAFAINLETGKTDQLLLRTDNLYPAQGGLGQIVGRGEKAGDVLMPAWIGTRVDKPSKNLLRVPLKSPRGRRFVRGTPDTRDWFVGSQGNVLARERYDNDDNMYRVQAYENRKWTTIYEKEDAILPMSIVGVTEDESGLLFIRILEDGFHALMKLGLDGKIEGPLLPPKDREIERIIKDNNRAVLGVQYAGVEPDYAFFDEDLQASFEFISEAFPSATAYIDSWSDNRDRVLYHIFDPNLGDIWLVHQQSDGQLIKVADRRPDIPPTQMGQMISLEYQARDGLTIHAIVTTPPTYDFSNPTPMPTLMLPHGGPASYDGFDFDWMAQYFANRGYVVVQPNFRGSEGFGYDFEAAGRGEWGGKMQDDITDGIDALAKANVVDPDRVCIAGASYGGYAALAGATLTPELYKCVIAIAPVSDLARMLRDEKRDRGKDHWVVSYWEDIMAEGDARQAKLREISPVNFADRVQAPILLMHGDDDTVVPFNQSRLMERALNRADKSVQLVRLKGEDHWLSVASTRLQTLREMDAFMAEHLPITN